MDVEAVRDAGAEAVKWCREGNGPIILEMKTYRYRGHSMSDPAKYRTREEVQAMREKRDPIEQYGQKLIARGVLSEDDMKAIDKDIRQIVNTSAEFATESPEPDESELYTDIVA
jgi:pyruvate dehydrogenase E1 component alpha subunit